MKMTEHQERLWKGMIDEIQNFLDGKTTDFFALVGALEGALDASEIKDKTVIESWYNFWTPLETRRAIEGNDINRKKAAEELTKMREFLLKTCRE